MIHIQPIQFQEHITRECYKDDDCDSIVDSTVTSLGRLLQYCSSRSREVTVESPIESVIISNTILDLLQYCIQTNSS
jgi:hypothetical protein